MAPDSPSSYNYAYMLHSVIYYTTFFTLYVSTGGLPPSYECSYTMASYIAYFLTLDQESFGRLI